METLHFENASPDQKTMDDLCHKMAKRLLSNPKGVCPVDMLLNFVRLCHAQSCGKCNPCRIGLGEVENMLLKIRDGNCEEEMLTTLKETATMIKDSADCAIGYGAASIVLEGIDGFQADLEEHIHYGKCLYHVESPVPCVEGCPAHVDIPGYIALTKAGRYEDALRLIRKDNPFPGCCGYVCEHPCEKHCRRMMVDDAINIVGLKRYAFDHAKKSDAPLKAPATGKKVAVIGGGPGGLSAAYFLALMGHRVTVYEVREKCGGMMRYGIPDYRLPPEILDADIDYILSTGIEVKYNTEVGKDVSLEDLKKNFDAVYISIGAHDHRKLNIPGEEGTNVLPAVLFLRDIGEGKKIDFHHKRVVVIGGGNVAMDATRTALRLGASSVDCVYRRRAEDMTALPEEVEEAKAEGARIDTLLAPDHIELDKEGKVCAFYAKPQLISTIENGRPSVKDAKAEPVRMPCDVVIVAIGQKIHSQPFTLMGLTTSRGLMAASSNGFIEGSEKFFAGGDAVSGPATVIKAVAAGKVAARNIDDFLGFHHEIKVDIQDIPSPSLSNLPACGRVNLKGRRIEKIDGNFELVSQGMSEEEKDQECSRCLRCDHFGLGSVVGGRKTSW